MSALNRGLPKFLTVIGMACAVLAFVLPLVAFVAPQSGSQTLGLLTVKPSLANLKDRSGPTPDGPSLFLGPLASCSKENNDGDMNCTEPSVNATYDTSNLPDNSLKVVLTPASQAVAGVIATSIAITGVFCIMFSLVALRGVYGVGAPAFDSPAVQTACGWLGSAGFMSGFVSFLILLMWFSKSVNDVNNSISSQGKAGPRLVAELGHSWFFVAGGYSAYLVPWAIAVMRMNLANPTMGSKV